MEKIKRIVSGNHSRRSSGSSDREKPTTSPRASQEQQRLPAAPSQQPQTSSNTHTGAIPRSTDGLYGQQQQLQQHRAGEERSVTEGVENLSLAGAHGHEHQGVKEGLGSKLAAEVVGSAQQDHKTLQPVLHERIHHHETEVVTRVKEVDRHVHHVQHHVQPLIEEQHVAEKHYNQTYPRTEEYEEHANTPEDKAFFAMLHKQKHTETHVCHEREYVDNGTTVRETVHYHVHNIIQPVIYRDRPIPSTCVPAASLASSARHPLQHHNHQQTTAPSSRAGPASREGGRGLAGQELGVAR